MDTQGEVEWKERRLEGTERWREDDCDYFCVIQVRLKLMSLKTHDCFCDESSQTGYKGTTYHRRDAYRYSRTPLAIHGTQISSENQKEIGSQRK